MAWQSPNRGLFRRPFGPPPPRRDLQGLGFTQTRNRGPPVRACPFSPPRSHLLPIGGVHRSRNSGRLLGLARIAEQPQDFPSSGGRGGGVGGLGLSLSPSHGGDFCGGMLPSPSSASWGSPIHSRRDFGRTSFSPRPPRMAGGADWRPMDEPLPPVCSGFRAMGPLPSPRGNPGSLGCLRKGGFYFRPPRAGRPMVGCLGGNSGRRRAGFLGSCKTQVKRRMGRPLSLHRAPPGLCLPLVSRTLGILGPSLRFREPRPSYLGLGVSSGKGSGGVGTGTSGGSPGAGFRPFPFEPGAPRRALPPAGLAGIDRC